MKYLNFNFRHPVSVKFQALTYEEFILSNVPAFLALVKMLASTCERDLLSKFKASTLVLVKLQGEVEIMFSQVTRF